MIDFLQVKSAAGATAFQPFNGGSIFNVAIGLGRLGCKTGFVGGLSQDFFGDMMIEGLRESKVDLSFATISSLPSTLAFVKLNNDTAEYVFLDEGSVGRNLVIAQLPQIPETVKVLHFGSFSLINDPSGATLEHLAQKNHNKRIITIDANIRPGLVDARAAYIARLNRLFSIADIIKVSDEDLDWLEPGISTGTFAARWLGSGVALVVVTKGRKGAEGFSRDHHLVQPAEEVVVADTIGAGDAFMAGLLASFDDQGLLQSKTQFAPDRNSLANALEFASHSAAICVSRPGADPPWANELRQ